MSAASSPRSDWRPGAGVRRPSKASPVTASSVHVDAQPSYGASPEGRAQSRQTLSKHLSQARLGVGGSGDSLAPGEPGRPRSSSSASYNSTYSAASSLQSTEPGHKHLNTHQSPQGSPGAPRRRSSAGLGSLPRSTSWYKSTSRKSSLAQPALSTIEGSVSDLNQEDTQLDSTTAIAPDNKHADDSSHNSGTNTVAMKRDRTSQQDAEGAQQPKRHAISDDNAVTEAKDPRVDEAYNKSWRSYLTLPRSSKPPSISSQEAFRSPATDSEPNSELSASTKKISEQPSTRAAASDTATPQAPPAATGIIPPMRRSPSPTAHKASPTDTPQPSQMMRALSSSIKVQSNPSAAVESDSGTEIPTQVGLQTDKVTQRAGEVSSVAMTPRPSSWWGWGGQSTGSNGTIQKLEHRTSDPFEVPAETTSAMPMPTPTMPVSNVSEAGEEDSAKHESLEAAINAEVDLKMIDVPYNGWSAWLGSYLGKPADTTSMTFAAGTAPSYTSSIASSNVPDADETSPEPPKESRPLEPESTPTPTLTRLNPLLEAVPRSSWSSFFTTRTLPIQKTIGIRPTHGIEAMEAMSIDFGSLAPEEMMSAGPSASTSTSGTSGSIDTSASAAGPSSKDSTFSSTSTIKPLTRDTKTAKGSTSSTTSKKASNPPKPPKPNLVLPSFEDVFEQPPRSPPLHTSPVTSPSGLKKAVTSSLSYFFSAVPRPPSTPSGNADPTLKGKERENTGVEHERLPKLHNVAGTAVDLHKNGRVVVIGVHGWFIQGYLKNVVGEPTGTSTKFASMMKAAVLEYYKEMGCTLNDEAITAIPLEGDGTVKDRTERLYENLMARQDWIEAVNNADRVFVASHSQGTIVSAMLVERLINEGEINGTRCAMLNMCSVSQGPFYSLYNSWTVPAYLYFETAAATELFEFQKPSSAVSKAYTESLRHILDAGVKILFVASLNDQVVPLYSALFSSLSHPNILRTIFIDSSAFETNADFMTNLVVFATRLRNAGLNCHGLDFHLSEALMGSLTGVGHSTVYDEALVYKYAVRFLLETSTPTSHAAVPSSNLENSFQLEDFNPRAPANPYCIIEDPKIRALFSKDLESLRDQFDTWQPKTKALQQVQAALEPLRLIPRSTRSEDDFKEAVSKTDKKATAKL